MKTNIKEQQQFILAKKRVEKIKKFYKHFLIYIAVNTFLSAIFIVGDMNDGRTFSDSFFRFKTFAIWIYWGAGIVYQALTLFGSSLFFKKDWKEKKIKEYLQEQKNNR